MLVAGDLIVSLDFLELTQPRHGRKYGNRLQVGRFVVCLCRNICFQLDNG
jgi:hypothetical protein